MKRRNEDDVGPVENRIAEFLPKVAPRRADCGEPVDKSDTRRIEYKKAFLYK
jgi:hypothetical protein